MIYDNASEEVIIIIIIIIIITIIILHFSQEETYTKESKTLVMGQLNNTDGLAGRHTHTGGQTVGLTGRRMRDTHNTIQID